MNGDIPPSVLLTAGIPPVQAWEILVTLLLVLCNGFFVAAEFAIVKVRISQLEVQSEHNKSSFIGVAKSIVNNLDAYLAATQLGITLASLGLGWVGEEVMTALIMNIYGFFNETADIEVVKKISIPLAFAMITILHIVFGELAPKSLAIHFPTKTAITISWPLKIFYTIFKPVIWLMNGLANLIIRAIGLKPMHNASEIHSEEELRVIISESSDGGAIEETEKELIQNVFDFDDRKVSNIQTLRKNISAIELNNTVKSALDYAISEGYSRFPVYEGTLDNIKGVIYTKDLVRRLLVNQGDAPIGPLLRKATFISESARIKNLLKEFQVKHIHMAIVTNEIGELAGIVTLEDILEELVGEIQDEYDNEKPIVQKTGDNTYLVDAHQAITDLNKYIPFKFEESEHYDTLSGLISELYEGETPKEGDKVALGKYDAIIVTMYRNSAESVELRIVNREEEEDD